MNQKVEGFFDVCAARGLTGTQSSPRRQVEAWLAVMVKANASDLILRAGGRPSLRVDGKISFLPGRVPGPGPMREVLLGVLGEKRLQEWTQNGAADAAIQARPHAGPGPP